MNSNLISLIIIILIVVILIFLIYVIHTANNKINTTIKTAHDYLNNNTRFVSKTNYDITYNHGIIPTKLPRNNNFDVNWGVLLSRTIMSSYIFANSKIDNLDTKLSNHTKNIIYGDLQLPDEIKYISHVADRAILLNIVNTNTYILAIRGTITTHDMWDDLNASQTLFYDLDKKPIDKAYVHHGCYNNWIELHHEYDLIWDLLPNNSELAICGHSQGATHAIFTSVAYARKESKNIKLMTYLYGSPRFGNNEFINYVDKVVPNNWLIINEDDMITTLPFADYYFDQDTYIYSTLNNKIIGEIQVGSLGLNHYINSYICMLDPKVPECPVSVHYIKPYVVAKYNN